MPLASNALTTVARIERELGVATGSLAGDDLTYVEDLINDTSDAVEQWLDRTLGKVVGLIERVQGFGGFRLILDRTPVLTITDVTILSGAVPFAVVATDDVRIEDADAGFLYRRAGWSWTAPRPPGTIARQPLNYHEDATIQVTYDGGYVLPQDGPAVAPDIDLPASIQRAVVLEVVTEFRARGRDRTIKSEKLLDWAATYANDASVAGGTGLPSSPFAIKSTRLLLPHRRIACV